MSMRPRALPEVPAQTAAVARAAFCKGALAMRVRDELGEVFADLVLTKPDRPSAKGTFVVSTSLNPMLHNESRLSYAESALTSAM